VKNDLLFDRIGAELKKHTVVEITEEKGLRMYAMPLPIPLPMELKLTVASTGDYLIIATGPTLVREALAVRAGERPGLRQSAEAQELLKYLPTEGNQFGYASKRFSTAVLQVQRRLMDAAGKSNQREQELFQTFFLEQEPSYGMSVSAHTATGWQSVSVGSQDSAGLFATGTTAIGAALFLPALAKAKDKAESIRCQNNMKQICLASHLWAGDHGNRLCFQVSQSAGGTKELCERGGDGYDHNAYQHFKAMASELSSPQILVCPDDKSKQPAADFATLQSWNVSYELRTGPSVTLSNPGEVLLYCPVHRHTGYTDGSVQRGPQGRSR
jgi:hypothetical protein